MSEHGESRREFLAASAGVMASAAVAASASAQSGEEVDKTVALIVATPTDIAERFAKAAAEAAQ